MAEGHGGGPIHVGVEYSLHDKASGGAHAMGHAFHEAAEKAGELRERIGEVRKESGFSLPAILGVGVGLGAWIEKTKEVNHEFEKTERMLSGLYATGLKWNSSVDFIERYRQSTHLAAEQTEQLEEVAARFGGSLGEVGEQYHQVSVELGEPLGLSRERLTELTEDVRATAKVMGVDGAQLIEKISNAALFKNVQHRGEVGKLLAQMLGGVNLKALRPEQILEKIEGGLKRLVPAADKMSQGPTDALNRIHLAVDGLQRALTAPLFREVGEMLNGWARSLQEVQASGKTLAGEYAQKLVDAFRSLREFSSTISEHWRAIALAWAAMKAGGMLQGLGASATGLGARMGAEGLLGAASTKLGVFASQLGLAAIAVGGLIVAFQLASAYLERRSAERKADAARMRDVNEVARLMASGSGVAAQEKAASLGLLKDGKLDEAKVRSVISSTGGYDEHTGLGRALGLPRRVSIGQPSGYSPDDLAKGFAREFSKLPPPLGAYGPPIPKDYVAPKDFAKGHGDVTIGTVEVKMNFEDVDPMQIMTRFVDDLNQQVGRRTQSQLTHHDL